MTKRSFFDKQMIVNDYFRKLIKPFDLHYAYAQCLDPIRSDKKVIIDYKYIAFLVVERIENLPRQSFYSPQSVWVKHSLSNERTEEYEYIANDPVLLKEEQERFHKKYPRVFKYNNYQTDGLDLLRKALC